MIYMSMPTHFLLTCFIFNLYELNSRTFVWFMLSYAPSATAIVCATIITTLFIKNAIIYLMWIRTNLILIKFIKIIYTFMDINIYNIKMCFIMNL